ncbi:MAG: SURF1 family protein [Rhodanobacteraceae bacterium]
MTRRWHPPRARALLLTVAGIGFFCTLGAWQIDRAHEKERLFAAFAGADEQPLVPLDQVDESAGNPVYPHVRVSGRYDRLHTYVLDDRVRNGRLGVMIYSVFEPTIGHPALLVDRGFLARTSSGAIPAIPPAPPGEQILSGLYAPPPGSGLRIGGNPLPRQKTWPKVILYLDTAEVAGDIGQAVDSGILLLDDAPGNRLSRDWRPQVFPASRHYGYAFTWFTFALIALAIFVGMHWRGEEADR